MNVTLFLIVASVITSLIIAGLVAYKCVKSISKEDLINVDKIGVEYYYAEDRYVIYVTKGRFAKAYLRDKHYSKSSLFTAFSTIDVVRHIQEADTFVSVEKAKEAAQRISDMLDSKLWLKLYGRDVFSISRKNREYLALPEPSEYSKILQADLEDARQRGDLKTAQEIEMKLQSKYI